MHQKINSWLNKLKLIIQISRCIDDLEIHFPFNIFDSIHLNCSKHVTNGTYLSEIGNTYMVCTCEKIFSRHFKVISFPKRS